MALGLYKNKESKERHKKLEEVWKIQEEEKFKEEMEEMRLRNRFERIREIVFYNDYDKLLTMEEVEYWEKIYGLR